ncbi:MAG: hypothetical protein KDC58_08990 [Cyclobacteriaceae bacterium]|nr:hypothetical protein [Cyclobacteriaceae bacterium]
MRKLYWATTYFVIGYAIVVATIVSLYQLPSSLRSSIGIIIASVVFVDLAYRFFKRTTEEGISVSWKSVVKLMSYWAFLSIGLDVLLLVVIIPLMATGTLNLQFFEQQCSLYWVQFPMFFVFGFVAQAMYNRVLAIKSSRTEQFQ